MTQKNKWGRTKYKFLRFAFKCYEKSPYLLKNNVIVISFQTIQLQINNKWKVGITFS